MYLGWIVSTSQQRRHRASARSHDVLPRPRAAAATTASAKRLCSILTKPATVRLLQQQRRRFLQPTAVKIVHSQLLSIEGHVFSNTLDIRRLSNTPSESPEAASTTTSCCCFPAAATPSATGIRLQQRSIHEIRASSHPFASPNVPSTPISTTSRCSIPPTQPQLSLELSTVATRNSVPGYISLVSSLLHRFYRSFRCYSAHLLMQLSSNALNFMYTVFYIANIVITVMLLKTEYK